MPSPSKLPSSAELADVVKRRGKVLAIDHVSLTFMPGEVVALLGPNGAGKSTVVGLLTGRFTPDAGTARLFGRDPIEPVARRRLGVMLQDAGMPRGLTVAEQIDLFRGYFPAPRERAAICELAGLAGLERRRCTALSGGQQRRLQFALAVCGRPDLLALDEPSTGLDVESRKALWAGIRAEAARGACVLLTTHHLEEAEALADRVVVLDKGRVIADGTASAIKAGAAASTIRCRTKLTDEVLLRLTGVTDVRREGHRVFLTTKAAQASLRAILLADEAVEEMTLSSASLEDAFTRLVADAAGAQPFAERAA